MKNYKINSLRKIANAAAVNALHKLGGARPWYSEALDVVKDLAQSPEGQQVISEGLKKVDRSVAPTAGAVGAGADRNNQSVRDGVSKVREGLSDNDKKLFDALIKLVPVAAQRTGVTKRVAPVIENNHQLNEFLKKTFPQSYQAYTGGSEDPTKQPGYRAFLQEYLMPPIMRQPGTVPTK